MTRKRFFLRRLWIMLCVVIMTGVATAGPLERVVTEFDTEQLIDMDDSDVAVIELESTPGTGFGWQTPDDSGQRVRIIKREFVPDNPGMPGTSGIEKIYVVSDGIGRSDLTFEYKRSFENRKALRSHTFRFNAIRKFRKELRNAYQTEDLVLSTAQASSSDTLSSESLTAVPSTYNWCSDHGGCTVVKNQGNCGSCWAFATVGPLEALIKASHGIEVDLSEQYLVSCNWDGWGCNGGWWAHNYHVDTYIQEEDEPGAVLESVKPYQARDTACNGPNPKAYRGTDYGSVGSANVSDLKQAILDHGPITVSVCADNAFSSYTGGVFQGSNCTVSNHGVVLVGWDDGTSSWVMRNSWGTGWGENGYMRIRYGVNNIGNDATYIDYPIEDGGNDDENNIALIATASTSYVSPWETLDAINDGCNPSNSNDTSCGAYGNWDNPNSTQWVQYDWDQDYTISSVEVYWFDDNNGVLTPTTAYISSWNGSDWEFVGDVPTDKDAWNTLNIDNVTTSSLRLSMLNPYQSTGILEWRVIGEPADEPDPVVYIQASFSYSSDYLNVQFTDTSSPTTDTSLTNWSWNFGDNQGSSSRNPDHSYAYAGTYNVSLTVTDSGGNRDTYSRSVSVTAPPKSGCGADPVNGNPDGMGSAYKALLPLLIPLLAFAFYYVARRKRDI